jgi:hypothetical protein
MAPLKAKGDLAELMVATDLIRRGFGLRISPSLNNQQVGIRPVEDYLAI